jgi:hypothetical protein
MTTTPSVDSDVSKILSGKENTESLSFVKTRIGQGDFRAGLIARKPQCALTGCRLVNILRASHIKPWRSCNSVERLDLNNGFLFIPTVDALFDNGLLSFTDDGLMLISPLIPEEEFKNLAISPVSKVQTAPDQAEYLTFHRVNVFLGLT